jgi:hypothetical protein
MLVLAKDKPLFGAAYGTAITVFDEFAGELDNHGETLTGINRAPAEDDH